ncbi:twin-arginine translocation signal domain-containing protein [Morganella morganii]|uniref:twin-arginine translocation signal domain-containing protein n=1 Tax=Morganella morganii TaxID=582 RepID=UPI001E37A584|nr:twin-arginine translocation signal domain-containing protein [Morganella morganii]MDI9763316.1 twin-arginine translocation signal domain-containing protein [Morganella morganii]
MSDRQKTGVTRRSFLKWTSAASAMAALPLSRQLHAATPAPAQVTSAAAPAAKGQWKPVACWHNCGGAVLTKHWWPMVWWSDKKLMMWWWIPLTSRSSAGVCAGVPSVNRCSGPTA